MTQPNAKEPPKQEKPPPRALTVVTANGGVEGLLSRQMPEIRKALPRFMAEHVERFLRIALTTAKRDQYLLESDPASFLAAVMEAAQLGLMIDGILGHAYLVSYYSKKRNARIVQMLPGYRGMISLARRSGEVAKVEPRVVYAGDAFEFEYGLEPKLKHRPEADPEKRGPWVLVYAVMYWRDRNIPPQFEVMSKADVMEIKKRSQSVQAGRSSPWDTDEIPMALKTVIRRLLKWAPLTPDAERLVQRAEYIDAGVQIEGDDVLAPRPAAIEDLAALPIGVTQEERAEFDAAIDKGQPAESEDEDAEPDHVRSTREVYEESGLSPEEFIHWASVTFSIAPRKTPTEMLDEIALVDPTLVVGTLSNMGTNPVPVRKTKTTKQKEAFSG